MLEGLKKNVLDANLELPKKGLVLYTWGNVSGFDRDKSLVVIKASGVAYEDMGISHMVVVDLNGKLIDGDYKPSSDTPTHLELYKNFTGIGGIVHTHSQFATQWAQAGMPIPCLGTTHADYFFGDIPCTRAMTSNEINGDYEKLTGTAIKEAFKGRDYKQVPAALVNSHGPFSWGADPQEAVHNSVVLEYIANMAFNSLMLNPGRSPIPQHLMEKHFLRKHGPASYYGQK